MLEPTDLEVIGAGTEELISDVEGLGGLNSLEEFLQDADLTIFSGGKILVAGRQRGGSPIILRRGKGYELLLLDLLPSFYRQYRRRRHFRR